MKTIHIICDCCGKPITQTLTIVAESYPDGSFQSPMDNLILVRHLTKQETHFCSYPCISKYIEDTYPNAT